MHGIQIPEMHTRFSFSKSKPRYSSTRAWGGGRGKSRWCRGCRWLYVCRYLRRRSWRIPVKTSKYLPSLNMPVSSSSYSPSCLSGSCSYEQDRRTGIRLAGTCTGVSCTNAWACCRDNSTAPSRLRHGFLPLPVSPKRRSLQDRVFPVPQGQGETDMLPVV